MYARRHQQRCSHECGRWFTMRSLSAGGPLFLPIEKSLDIANALNYLVDTLDFVTVVELVDLKYRHIHNFT